MNKTREIDADQEKYLCNFAKHARMSHCLWAMDREKDPAQCDGSCLCLSIKGDIIMLRRNKRDLDRFLMFKHKIENNLDFVTKHFNTRWMVSIMDTYADCGAPAESRNGMLVSLMVTWERFAHSILSLPRAVPKQGYPDELWDGILKFGFMKEADTHINLFRRLHDLISGSPPVYAIYTEIVRRMMAHPYSVLAEMDVTHPRYLISDIQPFLKPLE